MKGKRAVWTVSTVVVVLALLGIGLVALAQGGGGGGRGGGGLMNYLDQAWSNVTFELALTPDQLGKLQPTFQKAWNDRKAARADAVANNNFQGLRTTLQQQQKDLDAAIKAVLTDDQKPKWDEINKQLMNPPRRPGGGGGGGGMGGGGGAGGPAPGQ